MHDCPKCEVPLHGHEQFCPSCGTRQYVKPEYRNAAKLATPKVNMIPLAVAAIAIIVCIFVAAKDSWVVQILMHKTPAEDPLDKLTTPEARQIIEKQISEGLAAVGAPCSVKYSQAGKESSSSVNEPLEMTIETKLTEPNQHKAIIDPIKQYMDKAQIPTLVMHDAKSRATWTYSLSLPSSTESGADGH